MQWLPLPSTPFTRLVMIFLPHATLPVYRAWVATFVIATLCPVQKLGDRRSTRGGMVGIYNTAPTRFPWRTTPSKIGGRTSRCFEDMRDNDATKPGPCYVIVRLIALLDRRIQ